MAGSGRLALWSMPGQGWVRGSGPAVLSRLRDAAVVRPGFLSAAEEETLSGELEPELRRRRYELDLSSLGRPSTASERQRSRAGQRQAVPSCSVCRQPPLAPARPLSPRCTCWTWNLGATSSHTWTASSSVDPRLLACPCCLPASCGWCTPRSQGSGWNSCWSRAPSTSLGVRPVMTSPTRSFGMKSPFLGSVGFPGADASP
ncbi:alpha-ketoglutarate-dependent dioxygenase alkB homolog 7, mitochondrial isoform X2 [Kogia breviceps]|uniref:alpha-ketoglutarate-dependent dioxygenase alkB homolog 7, mitochondrial isoform X2 n=1 Tax=Kogia breviceps TaxID=27615 RepID=UPI0034D324EF